MVGLQVGLFFLAIVWAQDITTPNILYSIRSVFSVVLAWSGGWMLGLKDREAGLGVMSLRLVGAGLLVTAIVLVMV